MGGDSLSVTAAEFTGEIKEQLFDPSAAAATFRDVPLETMDIERDEGIVFQSYDDNLDQEINPEMLSFGYEVEKKDQVYKEILESYDETKGQYEHLKAGKTDILRVGNDLYPSVFSRIKSLCTHHNFGLLYLSMPKIYRPGSWIDYFHGLKLSDYDIPSTTTLLLVGPKGSGKSSLVNRISRVLSDDKFAYDRAQVSYNNYTGTGTYFLLEYMIPRGATNICLYDTRSLSENSSENMEMLKEWMTKGVRNGELVKRNSDSSCLKNEMKYKARHSSYRYSASRRVNYVIFVVNGLSVFRSISGDTKAKLKLEMVVKTFNYPFLSFKDDKPVVVMTHGDLLSLPDRAWVRLHLGELLGVPPMTQIFDIPENNNHLTEMEVVGMLRYSLEHADRNLPVKEAISSSVWKVYLSTSLIVLLVAVLYVIITTAAHSTSSGSGHSQEHFVPPLKQAPFKDDLTIAWHTARMAWRRLHHRA